MKNKLKILGLASLLITMVISACSDYLDQEVNGVSSIETFYATDEDAELAIIAAYDILTWHENSWGWASPILIKTLPSDEGTCGGGGPTDQPPYQALDDFAWDATNNALLGTWNVNYYGIFRTNMVIDNITPDNDLRKRIIAEAKGLRAYYYLELVTQFGDLPLVLKGLTPDEYNQARVPKAQVYAQIEKDLTEAIVDLPTKAQYSVGDKFRISKGTAYSLLGKAQLYQEKWAEAAASFELVTGYSLEPNFGDIFKDAFEFGQESIFEASYSSQVPYDWGYPWGTRHEDNIHIQLMGARAGSTPELGLIAGWGFNYPSPKLWNAYEAAGDTERRDATILSEATFLTFPSTDPAFDGSTWHDYEGYFRLKYGSYATETNLGAVPELNYGTNWRLIRYADILLLKAEAYYRSGNEAQARTALNTVRNRSGLADVTATGNALFNAIVNERMLELAFEGHRYFDLVRWGLAEQELGSLGYRAKHAVFPIPASELAAATLMTQNSGY